LFSARRVIDFPVVGKWHISAEDHWYIVGEHLWRSVGEYSWYIVGECTWYIIGRLVTPRNQHRQRYQMTSMRQLQYSFQRDCSKIGKRFRKTPPVVVLMQFVTAICAGRAKSYQSWNDHAFLPVLERSP